jgi:DNA (cytosine-5)-methyltransferase 1
METDEHRYKHLDLFSGIGGFSLAFEAEGFRTIAFAECDETKRIVLRHWWSGVPIFDDARDVEPIRKFCEANGGVDVLTGGVPCQPASALGQMRGTADERWMWPDAIRMVREIRPGYAVFENPASILVLDGGRPWNGIVSGLAACRFDCWWDVFPAAAFGAGHLRERVLLVAANADNSGLERHARHEAGSGEGRGRGAESRGPIAAPDLRGRVSAQGRDVWWSEAHTGIPVLAHGLPSRLVKSATHCAGDAVVPQVVRPIARAIRTMLAESADYTD